MKMLRNVLTAPLSLLLSLSLAAGFTLTAFASLPPAEARNEADLENLVTAQEPTGTLTLVKRDVLVNGNPGQTGMTILNNSLFFTGTGSHAVIEMGALGQVQYGPRTETRLTMLPNRVESPLYKCGSITMILPAGVTGYINIINPADVGVFSEHKEIDVKVERGEVLVKYGNNQEKIVKAGEDKDFDHPKEVSATGDVAFTVYCDEDHYPLAVFLPLGALLIPVFKKNEGAPPFLSTLQP